MDEAVVSKELGNAAFKSGNLEEALTHYTAALALDEQPIYLTNRSATFGRLARHEEALTDAEAACSLDPSWTKGYVRKADALARLGRADEGVAALEAGLQAVGDDALLQMALKAAKQNVDRTSIKGDVVDFAVQKSVGEAAVKQKDYKKAASSYGTSLDFMEAMLAKASSLPAAQVDELKAKVAALRATMTTELEGAESKNRAGKGGGGSD